MKAVIVVELDLPAPEDEPDALAKAWEVVTKMDLPWAVRGHVAVDGPAFDVLHVFEPGE